MLKKLYKYDLKNLSKILLPFSITLVGAGVLCCLLFLLAGLVPESLKGLIMLPCILLIFGIFIGGIAGTLYPYLYYYQSFFTDKAYLTFVFPANIKTQLNAKILSGVTYVLVTTLAMIFSIFLAFFGLFFVSGNLSSLKDIFVSLKELFTLLTGFDSASLVLGSIYVVLTPFLQIMLVYTAITLGSLLLSKHKIVGSIIFYFVTNWSVSIVRTIVSVIFKVPLANIDASVYTFISLLIELLLSVGIFVGTYFLSRHMLTNKLNLE